MRTPITVSISPSFTLFAHSKWPSSWRDTIRFAYPLTQLKRPDTSSTIGIAARATAARGLCRTHTCGDGSVPDGTPLLVAVEGVGLTTLLSVRASVSHAFPTPAGHARWLVAHPGAGADRLPPPVARAIGRRRVCGHCVREGQCVAAGSNTLSDSTGASAPVEGRGDDSVLVGAGLHRRDADRPICSVPYHQPCCTKHCRHTW